MESLSGRIIFITGASAGIGAATALTFAQHGCRLVLTGRNKANLEDVGKKCEAVGLTKDKMLLLVGDLGKESDIVRLVNETKRVFGAIDVLVNNAGVGTAGTIENMELTDLDFMYSVDVRAIVSLTQKFVPFLKKSKGASIINVSSVLSTVPMAETTGYCMLKAAVDQFSRCLAMDLAKYQIRVNSINPGTIRTDILQKSGYLSEDEEDKYYKETAEKYPLGRVGTPQDIANGIVFLASDAADFMTGTTMVVDGGASHTVRAI